MTTIKELSHDAYYNMQNYSQIIIDLVEECNIMYVSEDQNINHRCWEVLYDVDNLLEVIDPKRTHDVNALKVMQSVLNSTIKEHEEA